MSNFHGLELAKRALFAQQHALYTTGHNIANANTKGYTRQRVNFEADTALPTAAKNRFGTPYQIGTGVKGGSIERIRNRFLDLQFRGENSLAGYWEKRADALGRMENVLNDLNETGLSKVMDDFWSSLQDLAVNPTNSGARSVVVQRGIALGETFDYLNGQLSQIRSDLKEEVTTTTRDINLILENINELNKQIKSLEINGYTPNDLYDARDNLIDELSAIVPIEVDYQNSRKNHIDDPEPEYGGKGMDGVAMVYLKTTNPDGATENILLVDGIGLDYAELELIGGEANGRDYFSGLIVEMGGEQRQIGFLEGDGLIVEEEKGTLQSLVEAYGYLEEGEVTGDIIKMQQALKDMAYHFSNAFNELHRSGNPLEESPVEPNDFFVFEEDETNPDSWSLNVASHIANNPSYIAASLPDEELGDGSLAFELAKLFDEDLEGLDGKSIRDFYAERISGLAVDLSNAERMEQNTSVLITQLENNRQSVSSVSLDEEMTNLIKFQHAYNAAARTMTATDELIDRIINHMGLAGR